MTLFFVILFSLDWLHNGFIYLQWFSFPSSPDPFAYQLHAIISIVVVNLIVAAWTAFRLDVYSCLGSIWVLLSVLLGSQQKPTGLVVTLVVLLVLHPVGLLGGLAWARTKEREGRIRLEEEAEAGGAIIEGNE